MKSPLFNPQIRSFGQLTLLAGCCVALIMGCGKESQDNAKLTPVEPISNPDEVIGIAIIEPAEGISLLAPDQPGIISRIFAKPGSLLDSGEVILELSNSVERAQLSQSDARMSTQQDALEISMAGLSLLETQIKKAENDLKRDEELFAGNALTKKELEESRARLNDLNNQLAVQKAQVKQQSTRLGEIRAEGRYLQQVLSKSAMRAPTKGTLLSLDVRKGEFVDGRTQVGEFAPDGPLIALTEIDEMFAGKVKIGQSATIRKQGSNEVIGQGKVVLASPYLRKKSLFSDNPANLEDRRVREVRVQIDNPENVLIGARVECIIKTK